MQVNAMNDVAPRRRPRVYSIDGMVPVVDPSAYVHPSAVLIGDVVVGPGCYIGPCASLRGDFGRLRIGPGVNIQDNCCVHGYPEGETVIEEDGHIGHGAIIHCCTIRRNVLVGMNATVMDHADIGESSIIASSAVVKAGFQIPPRSLVAGVPARIMRPVTDEDIARKVHGTRLYQELAVRSLATMTECDALADMDQR